MDNQPENKQNLKKLLGIAVGVITFIIVSQGVQKLFFKPPSFDKILMQTASEINKTCPIIVDKGTRLDNVMAYPNNVFQYNYTITLSSPNVTASMIDELIKPGLLNNIKTNPDFKNFRDNNTTINYSYKDLNGSFIHKISIKPEQYK